MARVAGDFIVAKLDLIEPGWVNDAGCHEKGRHASTGSCSGQERRGGYPASKSERGHLADWAQPVRERGQNAFADVAQAEKLRATAVVTDAASAADYTQ